MTTNYTYKPYRYFIITFITTYVLWLAGAHVSWLENANGRHMLLLLPGLLAPFLISVYMIFRSGDPELRQEFTSRLFSIRRINIKMLPVLILMMPVVMLASIALSIPLGESVDQFQLAEGFSFTTGFVPVLLLLLMAAIFEELGWRGYAFDSLQSRFNYLTASVIFSVLWSLWHLPLIWVKDSYQNAILQENPWFCLNFFLSIIPMGILISWICAKNRKSVIAAILFHFLINMSQEMLEVTQITKVVETGVLTLLTLVVIAADRDLFFGTPSSEETRQC